MSPCDLERLYDEHAPALFAFLLNMVRNEADVRDLLQDIFVKLARRPTLLEDVQDERGFLIRLSHNAAIDALRRRQAQERRQEQLVPVTPFASSTDPDEEAFREALARALGTLPIEQRVVVHLRLWEGLTFETIAEVLELPLNTAASRYRYGLDKMREQLRPLYEDIQ